MSSPSARSAGPAPASTAPRPAMMAGRRAPASRSASAATADSAGRGGASAGPSAAAPRRRGTAAACTSSGSISTTARRSTRARRTARATSAIAVAGPCTRSATAPDRLHEPDLVDAEVRADRRGGHVGREHDQRRAALGRLGQAGHRVGQPRPLMDAARGEPPAHAPVAVGHADRAALVARRVEARAGVAHRVGDGEVAAAHEPEHGVHAQAGQRAADRLSDEHRAGDRRGASRPRCNQIRHQRGDRPRERRSNPNG